MTINPGLDTEAEIDELPPCEDCGGPWERTYLPEPGPQTVHVCTAVGAVVTEAHE